MLLSEDMLKFQSANRINILKKRTLSMTVFPKHHFYIQLHYVFHDI